MSTRIFPWLYKFILSLWLLQLYDFIVKKIWATFHGSDYIEMLGKIIKIEKNAHKNRTHFVA